jgi:predicted DNA-binding transcriptional regulator AlpA
MYTSQSLELERLPVVLQRHGVSRSLHLLEVAQGRFTPPVKIGRCALWPKHEVDAILAAKINGATSKQLAQLVTDLVEQRKALMPASMRGAA